MLGEQFIPAGGRTNGILPFAKHINRMSLSVRKYDSQKNVILFNSRLSSSSWCSATDWSAVARCWRVTALWKPSQSPRPHRSWRTSRTMPTSPGANEKILQHILPKHFITGVYIQSYTEAHSIFVVSVHRLSTLGLNISAIWLTAFIMNQI